MRIKTSLFLGVLTVLLVAGCTGVTTPPAQPVEQDIPPTSVPQATALPTGTAAVFEIRPTFTPIPTLTAISDGQIPGDGYGPWSFPSGFNPLTGQKVENSTLLERRPMVIKITNFPRSVRPQWGLTLADHIYEYYLERDLTRFIGIFYGQDAERVGPIRSARPFDEHIIRMYKAIFAFGYADDRVIDPWVGSDIGNLLVIERPGNCPPLCRIGPDTDYNTLFTNTAQLSTYITERETDNSRQDLVGLHFKEHPVSGGSNVNRIAIRFSMVSQNLWEYDPGKGQYLRSQETQDSKPGEESYSPLYDSLTEMQITADNLVILLVPTSYFFKSNSTEIFDFALLGQGPAYALRDGRLHKIKWNRPYESSLLNLFITGERHYPLKPGNVWFIVLSDQSTIETQADRTWQFTLQLPEAPDK